MDHAEYDVSKSPGYMIFDFMLATKMLPTKLTITKYFLFVKRVLALKGFL